MTKAKGQRSINKRKSIARLPKAKSTGFDYWKWREQNPYTSHLELPERTLEGGDPIEGNAVTRDIHFCNEAIRLRQLLLSADPSNHQITLTGCEKLIGQIIPSSPNQPSTEIKYLVILNDLACRASIKLNKLHTAFMFGRSAAIALHQMDKENWDLEEEPLASVATSALQAYDVISLMLSEVGEYDDDDAGDSSGEEQIEVFSDNEVKTGLEDEGDEVDSKGQAGNMAIRPATPNPLPTIYVDSSTQSTPTPRRTDYSYPLPSLASSATNASSSQDLDLTIEGARELSLSDGEGVRGPRARASIFGSDSEVETKNSSKN